MMSCFLFIRAHTNKRKRKRDHAPARANGAIRKVSNTKKNKCHKRRVLR